MTAEAAVVLPTLLVVLAMSVWVLACVSAQLRCVDAARVAARSAARGDAVGAAAAAGGRVAPPGAQLTVTTTSTAVDVTVRVLVRPFGRALRVLPPMALRAHAVAEREDVGPSGAPP